MKKNIIITLLIGLIAGGAIGFYTAGRVAKQRIDRMRKVAHEPGAEQRWLMNKLKISEEQEEAIKPILEKELPKQRKIIKEHRIELDSMREAMFKELEPLLNQEQVSTLERMKARSKRRHRKI